MAKDGGLDVAGIMTSAFNEVLKQSSEANTVVGAASITGFIQDVKRANDSEDPNALLKLVGTFLAVGAAGVLASNYQQKKELEDGSISDTEK